MIGRLGLLLIAAVLGATGVAAQTTPEPPKPAAPSSLFRPLLPLIGKTWRGKAAGPQAAEDVMRWEWAVGGHAVRVTHAVNGGVYGGETLIFPDRASGRLIFHYFTTGGFHTTGTIRETAPGVLEIEETVHGVDGLTSLRSTGRFLPDGGYQTRSLNLKDGKWVPFGGFDYREDAAARVVLPSLAADEAR